MYEVACVFSLVTYWQKNSPLIRILIHKPSFLLTTVYTTLDYEYRHKNKGTGQVLVPRKYGVYKLDQKSYKMCTVLIDMKYTLNAHPHTHRSHQYHVHCLHHYRLRIIIDIKIKVVVWFWYLIGKCGVYKLDQKS